MKTMTLCSRGVIVLLVGLGANAFAQSEPFSLTEAPFGSPTMDGDIADWMAMRNEKNVLNFSFTHGQRDNAAVGAPLEVNITVRMGRNQFLLLSRRGIGR